MTVAIVIDDVKDPRLGEFGRLFGQISGVRCFASYSKGTGWCLVAADGTPGVSLDEESRPQRADVTLVHASDWDDSISRVRQQLSLGIGKEFVFNETGDPSQRPPAIRIVRPTKPFRLGPVDAEQILTFATNPLGPLPRCCARPSMTLIALDILCQGYRATHGDQTLCGLSQLPAEQRQMVKQEAETTEDPTWWTKNLRLACGAALRDQLLTEGLSPRDVDCVHQHFEAAMGAMSASRRAPRRTHDDGIHETAPLQAVQALQRSIQDLLS